MPISAQTLSSQPKGHIYHFHAPYFGNLSSVNLSSMDLSFKD